MYRCRMVRVRQMVLKLRYRAVCGVFEAWADTVAYEMEESRKAADRAAFHAEMQRAEELRHRQIMTSSAQRMMKRGLSKCFASWLGWVTEKVAVRNMLCKIAVRIQNMYVSSALDSWQSWSSRRRQVRSICAKAVRRMHDMAVSEAWSGWWMYRCRMVRVRQMV